MSSKLPALRSRVLRFGLGFFAGMVPFLGPVQALTGIGAIVLYIPQSLMAEARVLTALVAGGWMLRQQERHWKGRAVRGLAAAVPLAVLVLFGFHQSGLLLRLGVQGGKVVFSEVISSQRAESCRCVSSDNVACVRDELSFDPDLIAECWGRRRVLFNRLVWILVYVVAVAGFPPLLALVLPDALLVSETIQTPVEQGGERLEAPIRDPVFAPFRPPEPVAETAEPLSPQAVFLSYAHEDMAVAERVASELSRQGMRVWWDVQDVQGGDSLPPRIAAAVAESSWFLVILSRHSEKSPWIEQEIGWAKVREISHRKPVIVPILADPEAQMPPTLADKAWIDFTDSEAGLRELRRRFGLSQPSES